MLLISLSVFISSALLVAGSVRWFMVHLLLLKFFLVLRVKRRNQFFLLSSSAISSSLIASLYAAFTVIETKDVSFMLMPRRFNSQAQEVPLAVYQFRREPQMAASTHQRMSLLLERYVIRCSIGEGGTLTRTKDGFPPTPKAPLALHRKARGGMTELRQRDGECTTLN